jgi:beta-glucosidase
MARFKQTLTLACMLFLVACQPKTSPNSSIQSDPSLPSIDAILAGMTVAEKVGQTCQITLDGIALRDSNNRTVEPITVDPQKLEEALIQYKIGSILNVGAHTFSVEEWQGLTEAVYAPYTTAKTKVPIIYGIDAIHGVTYTAASTLFPQEIGLAATWNPSLAFQFGQITAYEMRASGLHWNFSPVLDLGRSPLWSRHFETLGEDPFLVSEMGSAITSGYQGDSIGAYSVAACLKHFVGYSASLSGRDRTPAWIPQKYMAELYLPPFKKAVDAGALTLMINSGVLNGVPGHVNTKLLLQTLKEDWGFKGFTVSDWEDFIMLHTVHCVAKDIYDAVVQGFNAGVDMSMVPYSPQYKEYCAIMIKAVEQGDISMQRLDDAVRRILYVKSTLGLFEKDRNQAESYPEFGGAKHRKVAYNTAVESITLLENKEECLPLNMTQKVLVAGPTADNLIFLNGAWTHTWQGADPSYNNAAGKTIRQVFEDKLGSKQCLFAQGAELYLDDQFERTRLVDKQDFLGKAVQSDVIVLCLGEYPSTEKPGDIRSLNLAPEQLELAQLAYATNKKVILVLVEGRPRIIRSIVDQADAIVQAYLPGDHGAEALIDLLYGTQNFSGNLPYTYPRYDGVIEFYDHPRSVARAKNNSFESYHPQWDFGHGLNYSTVQYTNLVIADTLVGQDDTLKISVELENLSDVACKEVVQLYVSDHFASFVPAGKRLKAFQKIDIAARQRQMVQFKLPVAALKFADNAGNWLLEKGSFSVRIDALNQSFELQ